MSSRVTRCAVYGVAWRGNAVLLCRLSDLTPNPGMWTLPGGGMDFGEDPLDTLHREVHEETGLSVLSEKLIHVEGQHFRHDRGETHAVRIIYEIEVCNGEPSVLEIAGSTDHCEFIPFSKVAELPVVPLVQTALRVCPKKL